MANYSFTYTRYWKSRTSTHTIPDNYVVCSNCYKGLRLKWEASKRAVSNGDKVTITKIRTNLACKYCKKF